MDKKIDSFRTRAIKRHIWCEQFMNQFIHDFFYPSIFFTPFNILVLDNMLFKKKIDMLRSIFKKRVYVEHLSKRYKEIEFRIKNEECICFKSERGEFYVKDVLSGLEKINEIRNHLAHRLVVDLSKLPEDKIPEELLENLKNSNTNKDFKGNEEDLDKSYKKVSEFFGGLGFGLPSDRQLN